MAHIVLVGAFAESIVNFRGHLIRDLIARGHRVTALAAATTHYHEKKIRDLGCSFAAYPIDRTGRCILRDLNTFLSLRAAFGALRPDVVFSYTIKPIIWGGAAAAACRIPKFYALIEGLGYPFQTQNLAQRLVGRIVMFLCRFSLRNAARVIFINPDDRRVFLSQKLVRPNQAAAVDGIGVDLNYYSRAPVTDGNFRFLCVARLLRAKGVREFVAAARELKARVPNIECALIGSLDPGPDSISAQELSDWVSEGAIQYKEQVSDVRPELAACHVFVLPSYHEGMPRTVMEAMATGRPILTTDVPGCRETVVQGVNGFLVKKGDAQHLADRMLWFIENRDRIGDMCAASRRIAEERFDVRRINAELLSLMELFPPVGSP